MPHVLCVMQVCSPLFDWLIPSCTMHYALCKSLLRLLERDIMNRLPAHTMLSLSPRARLISLKQLRQ